MINQTIKGELGITNEDLSFGKINMLMPKLISDKHHNFVSRHNETGETYILNKFSDQLVLDKNKYLKPSRLCINITNSQEYGFIYYCFFNFLIKGDFFQSQPQTKLEKVAVVTFNLEEDGEVYEISENCGTLLGIDNEFLAQLKEIRDCQDESRFTIADISPTLTVAKIQEQGFHYDQVHYFYANIKLNFIIKNNLQSLMYHEYKRLLEEEKDYQPDRMHKAVVKFENKSYGNGEL